MTDIWIRATAVAPGDLAEATVQLHWATQFIASAGQTFVEPRSDDSHRAMTWSHELRAFVGEPFAGPYPFRVAVRPADLTLLLVGRTNDELGALPLEGQTRSEGYEWLALGMATYLGGPPPAIERPEYGMPDHTLRTGAPFSAGMGPELAALEAMYAGAASLLESLAASREDASITRVWPHHFDIATLLTLECDAAGEAVRTVGVGFAPMGSEIDSWYGYVSAWPAPDPARLPTLDGPPTWHVGEWTGAVLRGSDIAAAPAEARAEMVERFIRATLPAVESTLRRTGG